jgi:hypothetical protein
MKTLRRIFALQFVGLAGLFFFVGAGLWAFAILIDGE